MSSTARALSVFKQASSAIFATFVIVSMSLAAGPSRAQTSNPVPPRLSHPQALYFKNNPAAWSQFMAQLPRRPAKVPLARPPTSAWQALTNAPPVEGLSAPLLLTDGTVMLHNQSTTDWYRLTPDINGSYVNGTWSQIASLPSGYAPLYFASAVLPDGRVIINGGEYNNNFAAWTTLGAIYDPTADSWTSVSPPSGWSTIGDAQSVVLADGTYMLANCCSTQQALLNVSNMSWNIIGSGKADWNDEEGWTLLPDGTVLVVDAYVYAGCGTGTERYNPSTGSWSSAGNVPSQLSDCSGNKSYELGPQVLRPNGTVIAFGGTTTGAAHTAIFDTASNTWSAGPNVPSVGGTPYTLADAPAALLPSGNVLFAASPSNWPNGSAFSTPVHFFEFDGTSMTQVADTVYASSDASYVVNFLVLPTGQVLETDFTTTIEIYTPSGSTNSSWKPTISSLSSTSLAGCGSYVLSGTQLNGLSQGAAYGDDQQAATNFPIVRITNNSTGHVFYARTYGHSSMSVAPGTASATNFTLPADIDSGASTLVVVANGIASDPVSVTVTPGSSNLTVWPNAPLNLHGPVGGPFAADMSGEFTLRNVGSASLNYSVSLPGWLSVSPSSSGSLKACKSAKVMISPGPSALTASATNYSSTITFANTTNGAGNSSIATNLLVAPSPGKSLDPNDNGRSDPPPDAVAGINRPPTALPLGQ